MRIRILRRHIKSGKPLNHTSCPIALATRERLQRLKGLEWVSVTTQNIRYKVRTSDSVHYFDLSPWARHFVDNFDEGRPVKPFTFTAKEYV